jgi:hypothetical protein
MLEISQARLERATAKAKTVKPLVKVIEFRTYQVTNRETGAKYTVRFEKIGGKPHGECSCKAHQRQFYCYHLSAAIGIHIILAAQTVAI